MSTITGQRPGTTLKDLSLQSSFDSLATDVTDLMLHDRVPATAATKVDEGVAAKGGASCHSEKKDFGQTCPTPKETKDTDRKKDKRKSLAYYLPLNNSRTSSLSSSTERKVLRSVRNAGAPSSSPDRHMEEESMMGKENRDILANYMSSLSTNTATTTRGKKKATQQPFKPPSKPSTNRCGYIPFFLMQAFFAVKFI